MEDELFINIYQFIGEDMLVGRTTPDGSPSAESLRHYILENWDKYRKISISLESIVKITRTFYDEAFAKLLEDKTLEEFNEKIYFPDAKEAFVKEMNQAFKLRLKIIASKKERESGDGLGF
ncbi:hypothetical protein NITGR_360052 [Nitrospina gracilis 3/211]|uniref:DUF4325 domain-containing protein n=1 Tax=Nitrospina gracilis (strain 3/211) TaxID=1266370 RepID=M1YYF4_NITG3|nr:MULTISPECIES: DUF4325 domain-containing protein [Nitrospina]MCF8723629.1 hypothetical protein [Nitrospina sp. Nb-3]CCQ90714.1 hypothetical protein NITGR_360052 [Nitrospina gracilis 3/211]